MSRIKIGIAGAGAMGCVYGGNLAEAGHEVWLLDVWQAHIAAIQERGLHLEGASGDRIIKVNASIRAQEIGPCELVIIATKAADIDAAVRNAAPMIGPQTLVLTIQNGVGNAERIADHVDVDHLIIGIAQGFGASIISPGHVHHHGWELIHLGNYKRGITESLKRVSAAWEKGRFRVRIHEDIQSALWSKLVCNVAFSAICTVAGLKIGQVMKNPYAWQIAKSCAQEAAEVAKAKGIDLQFEDAETYIRDFGSKIPGARPSMLLDLEAGRRCEVDSLNGAVAREAANLGVSAPVNDVITVLVKAMEDRRQTLGQPFGIV